MRSFRGGSDERAVGFGLIISAYLIRITRHDHRARPERVCVTAAITGGGGQNAYPPPGGSGTSPGSRGTTD